RGQGIVWVRPHSLGTNRAKAPLVCYSRNQPPPTLFGRPPLCEMRADLLPARSWHLMDWLSSDFPIVLLGAATLLLLGVLASKASYKLGVPALLLFLAIGMLAGSEGIGGIEFDDAYTAQLFGTVALVFILFSGGLDT